MRRGHPERQIMKVRATKSRQQPKQAKANASVGTISLAQVHRLEESVSALRRDLGEQDRLATLGLMSAGIAHEVNNLLTPALVYAQQALTFSTQDPAGSPEQVGLRQWNIQRSCTRVIESLQRASVVINALLDFAGNNPNEVGAAVVADVLAEAVQCLGRDLAQDGITFVSDVAPALTAKVRPVVLQHVLLNLLLNARRALHGREGARIRVEATRTSSDRVRIVVEDNGPGIHPDSQFSTNTNSKGASRRGANRKKGSASASAQSGHGLGLTICHRTIADAGGTLEGFSAGDGGARFVIELPALGEQSKE